MTSQGTSRTARRAAATYRAIVDAAEEVMLEYGSDALTLDAVADRADVAVQTIYNRVGGRSALLVAVAERAFDDNRQYMDAAYAAPGAPVDRILRAAEAYARFAAERPHQFRLLVEPPDEPDALTRIADLVAEQNNKLAAALADGAEDGSINPHLDPATAATALWAAMNGILALTWRADRLRSDDAQARELVTTMTTMITQGLFTSTR
ncbi:transcriptional regulator, TetR family protein (plasmid) [Rhodococcus jostii RHA1]|uniref:Transcriptional regulator, TetR family protein n=1 Tax=Rhodococcus jostii (strain RHA1) TaxID=101510 RepID=Q0RXI4_RHOJR|nr:TetR/AcrR family transcriptional regulator [Rhodococcus jostii]ABH00002.1 transcriptional regulator, TetR family protein [Rhodococcus jostii RHA1]